MPRKKRELDVPWITEDGYLDVTKFPIDGTLEQTLSKKLDEFRDGCTMLKSMQHHGRLEAGIHLLGLFHYCRHQLDAGNLAHLERLKIVVETLGFFDHKASAEALFSELKRIKSSNVTKEYINVIIVALVHLPRELVNEGFSELSQDQSFSYRRRKRFKHIVENWDDRFERYLD